MDAPFLTLFARKLALSEVEGWRFWQPLRPAMGREKQAPRWSHTIADHALAPAAMAEDRLDRLADPLGAPVLAAIRRAEFSLLLRPGKYSDRNCVVVGEPADLFLDCVWTAFIPDALHRRFRRSFAQLPPHHRRHRIHVRSRPAAPHSPPQFVSRGHAAAAAVGDLAPGLRPARMEVANADGVGRSAAQLFLAARAGCELGPWLVLP